MQSQFDVDVDRKQWILDTQPRNLVQSGKRQAESQVKIESKGRGESKIESKGESRAVKRPESDIEHPKSSVLTVAHTLSNAFSGVSFTTKASAVVETPDLETRVSGVIYIYIIFVLGGVAVTPAVLNYGYMTPYYAVCTVLPVALSAITLHVLVARAQGNNTAMLCGFCFIMLCLPACSLILKNSVADGRWALHLSLAVLELFYCLTLSERWYITTLGCAVVVGLPVALTEIVPSPGESRLMLGIYWNMLCSLVLGIYSALQYTNEKVSFNFSRVN